MGKSDTIQIYLRIRPARGAAGTYSVEHEFDHSIVRFHVDRRLDEDYGTNNSIEDYRFRFERVFDQRSTQEELFDKVAKEVVLNAMDGYNSTIFAYGQTGSGKTFSITGGEASYNDRGIIPRAISLIFEETQKRQDYEWTIRMSYLQIYNDKGQDLLNNGKDAKTLDDLPIVTIHETDEEIVLKGLDAHLTNSVSDALNKLFLGDTNRLYCETPMNKTSSRSHCVCTMSIEGRQTGTAVVRRSKLNLVDLAGSERVARTGVTGTLLAEAKYINLSLHYLEHVIKALAERKDHVPYRNSMMTMVLRDSLGGNCRSAMLATAHPDQAHIMETMSTCRFAQRVASIKQSAHVNEETDPRLLVRKLRAEVAQLKEQMSFLNKGESVDRPLDNDEMARCREAVMRYVQDSDPESKLTGLNGDFNRILYCFRVFKDMCKGKPIALASSVSASTPGTPSTPPDSRGGGGDSGALRDQVKALQLNLQQKENELNLLFTIVEKHGVPKAVASTQTHVSDLGLGSSAPLPTAPARQQTPSTPNTAHTSQLQAAANMGEEDRLREGYNLGALADTDVLKERTLAFEDFRKSYRKYEQIEKGKADVQKSYADAKAAAEMVNLQADRRGAIKKRIQQLRAEKALLGDAASGGAAQDPEETALRAELADAEAKYKEAAQRLAKAKERVDHMHLLMDKIQQQLEKDFQSWYALRQGQVMRATGGGVASSTAGPPSITPPYRGAAPAGMPPPGASQQSQPSGGGGTQAPNPYAPQYRSTGDPQADADLARMYKAREEMRQRSGP